MRICADCHVPDALYYDIGQPCRCIENGFPIGETVHDVARHKAACARLRHTVTPYRKRLRMFRKPDGRPDEFGYLDLPAEFAYLKRNGFVALVHSGYLWAEKMICRPCIVLWEQRQTLKRDYEARCALLSREEKPHEYEQMICF